ncbi:hypothetical protein ESP57_08655 [Agromyces fucosus]|uniref:Uncharacterized protein n=1 Tax=Agromyces fucosus TaxID=41985 RepID=A0A4Q2JSF4_9MICO|nr:hypothetical protein [Agromyces fucosus]RXZ49018.1 hypothetical protein ESP57_08655 [Agromyces fucosus]
MGSPDDEAGAGATGRTVMSSGRHLGGVIGTVAICAVICLQIALPLIALLQPPPQEFGFQMYSSLGGVTAITVGADGVEHPVVDLDRIVAKDRPEVDWLPLLPEAICEADAAAMSVQVEQSGRVRSIECD